MPLAGSLFTLGYQAHTTSTMLRVLRENQIDLVVDIRQNPVSRKPGFSRYRLARILSTEGIEYLHYPCFGTPRSIRDRYCKNGDIPTALERFEEYLDTRQQCVKTFLRRVSGRKFCLVCFERDHMCCHRSIVAKKLAEITNCQPIHLA